MSKRKTPEKKRLCRIKRDDLVIKANSASLVLGNNLWLETDLTVTRNLDGQFTEFTF